MSRKIWELKIDVMMKREKEMDFPEFIRQLRSILGFSRKVVADDTGITRAKLLDLEHGHFSMIPKEEIIHALAEYYEVPLDFLKRKCEEYCVKVQSEKKQYAPFYQRHPEWTPTNVLESQGLLVKPA